MFTDLNVMFMKDVGNKRGFSDLEDDEDDFFGSKKVFLPYINLIYYFFFPE